MDENELYNDILLQHKENMKIHNIFSNRTLDPMSGRFITEPTLAGCALIVAAGLVIGYIVLVLVAFV